MTLTCVRVIGRRRSLSLTTLIGVLIFCRASANSHETAGSRDPSSPREYCEFEVFSPRCPPGELIVMTAARYGRMRLGRCVEADLGFLGCFKDVLALADRKCSGRPDCSVRIPDPEFDGGTRPCYKELKTYLEASYACQRVVEPDFRGCTVSVPPHPARLAVPAWTQGSCPGTPAHPWVLETLPGQRLNLSLVDFTPHTTAPWGGQGAASLGGQAEAAGAEEGHGTVGAQGDDTQTCRRPYARVYDPTAQRSVAVCGDSGARERWLFESAGSRAELSFVVTSSAEAMTSSIEAVTSAQRLDVNFMIRFESTGCPDLRAPPDGWLKREGGELTVGCDSSRQTWHLRCEARRWTGVIGNCTARQAAARIEALVNSQDLFAPHALAVITVAGIALALCCVIVCVGVVCYRRFAEEERQRGAACLKPRIEYDHVGRGGEDDPSLHPPHFKPLTAPLSATVAPPLQFSVGGHRNDYFHVWERPLPFPSALGEGGMLGEGEMFLKGVMPSPPVESGGVGSGLERLGVADRGCRVAGGAERNELVGPVTSELGVRPRTDCEAGC